MIEEKLSRLTPRQREEVENFIDFLMTRDSHSGQFLPSDGDTGYTEIQDRPESVTPSIFEKELSECHYGSNDLLPDYPEYGEPENFNHADVKSPRPTVPSPKRAVPKKADEGPGRLLDWVD
jgi:hypothetical protein